MPLVLGYPFTFKLGRLVWPDLPVYITFNLMHEYQDGNET